MVGFSSRDLVPLGWANPVHRAQTTSHLSQAHTSSIHPTRAVGRALHRTITGAPCTSRRLAAALSGHTLDALESCFREDRERTHLKASAQRGANPLGNPVWHASCRRCAPTARYRLVGVRAKELKDKRTVRSSYIDSWWLSIARVSCPWLRFGYQSWNSVENILSQLIPLLAHSASCEWWTEIERNS